MSLSVSTGMLGMGNFSVRLSRLHFKFLKVFLKRQITSRGRKSTVCAILAINCSVVNSTGSLSVGFELPLGKVETFKEREYVIIDGADISKS